jgi:hypothetical protein
VKEGKKKKERFEKIGKMKEEEDDKNRGWKKLWDEKK